MTLWQAFSEAVKLISVLVLILAVFFAIVAGTTFLFKLLGFPAIGVFIGFVVAFVVMLTGLFYLDGR